jgi:peroxin-2
VSPGPTCLVFAGRYPTLPMALLRLRLAYTRPNAPRLPEFDLMNQQLAWQHITDTISSARALFAPVTAAAPPHAAAGSAGWLDWLLRALRVRAAARPPPAHACGFCAAAPMHTPQRAPCGHVFCYYCLASACAASGRPRCPRCAARLELGERCPAALIPRPPPAPAGGEEAATAWPTPTTQETGQAQGG